MSLIPKHYKYADLYLIFYHLESSIGLRYIPSIVEVGSTVNLLRAKHLLPYFSRNHRTDSELSGGLWELLLLNASIALSRYPPSCLYFYSFISLSSMPVVCQEIYALHYTSCVRDVVCIIIEGYWIQKCRVKSKSWWHPFSWCLGETVLFRIFYLLKLVNRLNWKPSRIIIAMLI